MNDLDKDYYDLQLNEICKTFKGHRLQIGDMDFSKDMRYLISGSHDRSIRCWKISDITGAKEMKYETIKRSLSDSFDDSKS